MKVTENGCNMIVINNMERMDNVFISNNLKFSSDTGCN